MRSGIRPPPFAALLVAALALSACDRSEAPSAAPGTTATPRAAGPEAEAYGPERAECGETVTLAGQGRSSEPGRALSFEWVQTGEGPRVEIASRDRPQCSFVAPETPGGCTLALELHVRDGVNPDAVAKVFVPIECDPRHAALKPGERRDLGDAASAPQPLPRGSWELSGTLALQPTDPDRGPVCTLRFEYAQRQAAAISLAVDGPSGSLRMFGLQRDAPDGAWYEPESSGERPLGDWPADAPLGFVFEWDGRELAFHWGPAGARDAWEPPPFPVSFPLAARPRVLALAVERGTGRVSDLTLTGR